jgi:hypothetical protein
MTHNWDWRDFCHNSLFNTTKFRTIYPWTWHLVSDTLYKGNESSHCRVEHCFDVSETLHMKIIVCSPWKKCHQKFLKFIILHFFHFWNSDVETSFGVPVFNKIQIPLSFRINYFPPYFSPNLIRISYSKYSSLVIHGGHTYTSKFH